MAAVSSNSLDYFDGQGSRGIESTYTGLIKVKSDTREIVFKKGITTNTDKPYLLPALMALKDDGSHLAMVYADTENVLVGDISAVRLAIRFFVMSTANLAYLTGSRPFYIKKKNL